MIAESGFKRPSNLTQFSPRAYRGDSPPRRDIIQGRLPRGKVVILAGEGDIGKSWLLLELHRAINDGAADVAFGGNVVRPGSHCIYLSGEDDRVTLDLRLKTIRQGSKVEPAENGLLIPGPNLGNMPLVSRDIMGKIVPTDVYTWLDEQLDTQKSLAGDFGLGFLGIDTWSTFFQIDANNNSEVHSAIALMTELATKHDVCIIITHHVAKHSEAGTRASIRGATALVDGSRAAYTFFKASETEASFVHSLLDAEDFRGDVIKLQIVKNNLGLYRSPITYVRQADGRLQDVSDRTYAQGSPDDALVALIRGLNAEQVRVVRTGENGLYRLRSSKWPPCLFRLSKHQLERLAASLLKSGRLEDKGKAGLFAAE